LRYTTNTTATPGNRQHATIRNVVGDPDPPGTSRADQLIRHMDHRIEVERARRRGEAQINPLPIRPDAVGELRAELNRIVDEPAEEEFIYGTYEGDELWTPEAEQGLDPATLPEPQFEERGGDAAIVDEANDRVYIPRTGETMTREAFAPLAEWLRERELGG
jgi:hypothetical protein